MFHMNNANFVVQINMGEIWGKKKASVNQPKFEIIFKFKFRFIV